MASNNHQITNPSEGCTHCWGWLGEWRFHLSSFMILVYGLILKWLLCADHAARLSIQAGAAGIIVSNHGARQLDYVPATIMALEEVSLSPTCHCYLCIIFLGLFCEIDSSTEIVFILRLWKLHKAVCPCSWMVGSAVEQMFSKLWHLGPLAYL